MHYFSDPELLAHRRESDRLSNSTFREGQPEFEVPKTKAKLRRVSKLEAMSGYTTQSQDLGQKRRTISPVGYMAADSFVRDNMYQSCQEKSHSTFKCRQ